jgi:endonuclease YncB( thermonuclease family)
MKPALIALMLALASPWSARAEIVGRAAVVDGHTLEIAGQRIRLFGIEAPGEGQLCAGASPWRCGQQAAFALAEIVGPHWVHCAERGRDRDGRVAAVCRLAGPHGPDANARMVRQGWARADRQVSTDYVDEEQAAKNDRAGVWRGTTEAPW